jgi:transposase
MTAVRRGRLGGPPALRCHPETQAYIARKRAEGKTSTEAIRCLKRHLTRRIWHLLQPPTPRLSTSIS